MEKIVSRLQQFLESEARSCSMDFGCVTPLYIYRMWGGTTPLEEISEALMYYVFYERAIQTVHPESL